MREYKVCKQTYDLLFQKKHQTNMVYQRKLSMSKSNGIKASTIGNSNT